MSPRGTTLYDEDILSWCSQWYTCCMLMLRAREIPTWVGMYMGSLHVDLASSSLASSSRPRRAATFLQQCSTVQLYSVLDLVQLYYSCITAVVQLYYSCTVQLYYSCSSTVQL